MSDKTRNPEKPAKQTTGSVGPLLRQARESFGESLDDVSRVLKIKRSYLHDIESGRIDRLPKGSYARGFVRTYARHLGLDPDEIIRRFGEEHHRLMGTGPLPFPTPSLESSKPGGRLVIMSLLISLLVYGIWVGFFSPTPSPDDHIADEPLPARVSDAVPDSPARTAMPPPVSPVANPGNDKKEPQKEAQETPPPDRDTNTVANNPKPVFGPPLPPLIIQANADVWVVVNKGERKILRQRMKPGDYLPVVADKDITLGTNDTGALNVLVNGVDQGPLGPRGKARLGISLALWELTSPKPTPPTADGVNAPDALLP